MPDPFGRTPIADSVKVAVTQAFAEVPEGKRGALLVIADEHGPRAMLAARINDRWKVAAGGGKAWNGPIEGTVAIVGSW